MELLRISDGNAEYWKEGGEYGDIKEIDRKGILDLLARIYNDDGVIVASPEQDAMTIKDPASRIIFENIKSKLDDFLNKRDALRQEIDSIFGDIERQYKEDLSRIKKEND